jgi:hypothetical protein
VIEGDVSSIQGRRSAAYLDDYGDRCARSSQVSSPFRLEMDSARRDVNGMGLNAASCKDRRLKTNGGRVEQRRGFGYTELSLTISKFAS